MLKTIHIVNKMTWQVEPPVPKSDDLSYTARMHLVQGEYLLLKMISLSLVCLSVSLTNTNKQTHTYVHIYICMFVCMYVWMYIYIYIHTSRQKNMSHKIYLWHYWPTSCFLGVIKICLQLPFLIWFCNFS